MRIELRFGLILAACFVFGLGVAGYISYALEFRQAQSEMNEKSRALLEMGLAMRTYTGKQIAPLVSELGFKAFHPQMVPSYGAQTVLASLRQRFPDFRYRESSLNPINIEDRATDREVGLLRAFQGIPRSRNSRARPALRRPSASTSPARCGCPSTDCLQCHSTPEAATDRPADLTTLSSLVLARICALLQRHGIGMTGRPREGWDSAGHEPPFDDPPALVPPALLAAGQRLHFAAGEILPAGLVGLVLAGSLHEDYLEHAFDLAAVADTEPPPGATARLGPVVCATIAREAALSLGLIAATLAERFAHQAEDPYLVYHALATRIPAATCPPPRGR